MLAEGGKYGKFITALRTIVAVKSFEGPVRLAQEFGFITDQDAANALENLANKSNDIQLLTPTLQKIVQDNSIFNAKTELPSHVLKAIGHSDEDALASARFSLGYFTTPEEVDVMCEVLSQKLPQLL
jgi:cysteine desulfurase